MSQTALLLTGTVNPRQMAFTKLLDPQVRRKHYVDSLNHWLKTTTLPIVFVENSGADLSKEIDAAHAGRIEFLTFSGNDYPSELGKGYGELRCLEHASKHSRVLKQSAFVFKVTGRIKIMNFNKFERFYAQHTDTYVLLDFKRSLTFADSRLFGFHPSFLPDYFLKRQNEVNDTEERFFENVLAKSALSAILEGRRFRQMPFFPEMVGMSGTDNRPYKSGYFYFLAKQIQFFLKSKFINE